MEQFYTNFSKRGIVEINHLETCQKLMHRNLNSVNFSIQETVEKIQRNMAE